MVITREQGRIDKIWYLGPQLISFAHQRHQRNRLCLAPCFKEVEVVYLCGSTPVRMDNLIIYIPHPPFDHKGPLPLGERCGRAMAWSKFLRDNRPSVWSFALKSRTSRASVAAPWIAVCGSRTGGRGVGSSVADSESCGLILVLVVDPVSRWHWARVVAFLLPCVLRLESRENRLSLAPIPEPHLNSIPTPSLL
ncbi:unnamed protein product [Pleuronectes platessa]|uniref:Uncharacterized protein n=1 Tax=Pleuronectes platessa TaxID=8262 RepID=A0A9N7VN07_PLEPL|nr:unnamed protein product [Pleuronectes platessa]